MLFVLFVCRCVCAASGLCLPAVPEGQTDQAGVPDPVLPGSLCSCWSGFPLRHLSDIHRWVHRRALKYVFCTRTKTTRLRMKIKQRYVFFFCPATQFKAEYHTDYSKAGHSPGSTYHLSWRICHANNTNTDLHFQLGVNGGNKYSCRAAYGPRLRGFIFWSRVMIGSLTQYRDITRNSCPDCMRVCYSMKLILDE